MCVSSNTFQALQGMGGKLKFNLNRLSSQNAPCSTVILRWQRRLWSVSTSKSKSRETTSQEGKQAQQHCSPGEAFTFFLSFLVCFLITSLPWHSKDPCALHSLDTTPSHPPPSGSSFTRPHPEMFMHLLSNEFFNTNLLFLPFCKTDFYRGVMGQSATGDILFFFSHSKQFMSKHADQRKTHFN